MAETVVYVSSGIPAVFLSLFISKPLHFISTTVLGSKTIRERFTHLNISNFLYLSRKLWSIQAMVI